MKTMTCHLCKQVLQLDTDGEWVNSIYTETGHICSASISPAYAHEPINTLRPWEGDYVVPHEEERCKEKYAGKHQCDMYKGHEFPLHWALRGNLEWKTGEVPELERDWEDEALTLLVEMRCQIAKEWEVDTRLVSKLMVDGIDAEANKRIRIELLKLREELKCQKSF